ncbi:TlpA disulfide reductase family protein [soil metagenome]
MQPAGDEAVAKRFPLRKRSWLLACGALAACAVAIYFLAAGFFFTQGRPAPAVAFTGLLGETISAETLRGKVVIVNFWSPTCVDCIKEMPTMVDAYEKFHGRGLEFVAVAMSYDAPNEVAGFVRSRKLPFKIAHDVSGNAASAFGHVRQTPTTFVIDRHNQVIKRYVGVPDIPAFHRLLEKALAV